MSPRQPDFTEAVEHLKNADPKMAALIKLVGPCTMTIRHHHTIFYSLLRAITYQQLAGAAAAKILSRVELCCSSNGDQPTPELVMAASDESLRAAGLSRNKLAAIRDLATKTLDGTVPELKAARRMDDEEIIEHITKVRGIGRWTVEMLLISRLGRPDVWPVDDYGIRAGFAAAFRKRKLPAPKELVKPAAKWKPYRSVASWYLWRAADRAKK